MERAKVGAGMLFWEEEVAMGVKEERSEEEEEEEEEIMC